MSLFRKTVVFDPCEDVCLQSIRGQSRRQQHACNTNDDPADDAPVFETHTLELPVNDATTDHVSIEDVPANGAEPRSNNDNKAASDALRPREYSST